MTEQILESVKISKNFWRRLVDGSEVGVLITFPAITIRSITLSLEASFFFFQNLASSSRKIILRSCSICSLPATRIIRSIQLLLSAVYSVSFVRRPTLFRRFIGAEKSRDSPSAVVFANSARFREKISARARAAAFLFRE